MPTDADLLAVEKDRAGYDRLLFLQWLIDECGYLDVRPLPPDAKRWSAIMRKAFTHAIITGPMGDRVTISENWCYETYAQAKAAYDNWNGEGEPVGWFRHPGSGRRVALQDGEINDEGQPVKAGEMYTRK